MNKRLLASILCAGMILTMTGFSLAEGNEDVSATTQQTTTAQSGESSENGQSQLAEPDRYQVLVLGDKDQEGEDYIKKFQERLAVFGNFKDDATGYYGELTQKAVMEFQKEHGMTVDGKAGPAVQKVLFGKEYQAISETRKVVNAYGVNIDQYAPGDRGEEITKVQNRLKSLGYYEYGRITDYYGPITEDAVVAFKEQNGLNAESNIIDAKTQAVLFSSEAKKATETTAATTTKKVTDATQASPSTTTTAKQTAEKTKETTKQTTAPTKKPTTTTKKQTTTTQQTSGTSSTTNTAGAEKMISTAMAQVGDPYVWGATGPNSFDCSGLVVYSLKAAGKSAPRTSSAQSQNSAWQTVNRSQLKRGDLVFFSSSVGSSSVGHVGIYLGGGQFVHAASGSAMKVTVSNIDSSFYKSTFKWGKRVF